MAISAEAAHQSAATKPAEQQPVSADHPAIRTSLLLAEAAARRTTFGSRRGRIIGFH